jgi:hypothetical protein
MKIFFHPDPTRLLQRAACQQSFIPSLMGDWYLLTKDIAVISNMTEKI